MTNKLTLTEQEELFAKDCKLINLKYEYDGYTGTEKWAVVTELTEEELWDKYPDIISRYTPFVLLSMAQGKVIIDDNRESIIRWTETLTVNLTKIIVLILEMLLKLAILSVNT